LGDSASPSLGQDATLPFVARGRGFKSQQSLLLQNLATPTLLAACCNKMDPTITLALSRLSESTCGFPALPSWCESCKIWFEYKGFGGSHIEYISASLGFAFWVSGARLLRVRQEAEGGRPPNLRTGPHGLPLFHFQYHSSCRNWGRAHNSSLLCQNLNNAGHGRSAQLSSSFASYGFAVIGSIRYAVICCI
jgi:hypothetical protein